MFKLKKSMLNIFSRDDMKLLYNFLFTKSVYSMSDIEYVQQLQHASSGLFYAYHSVSSNHLTSPLENSILFDPSLSLISELSHLRLLHSPVLLEVQLYLTSFSPYLTLYTNCIKNNMHIFILVLNFFSWKMFRM